MNDVLKILFYIVHGLVSLGLIALVVAQTSKHEGLGVVGGSSGPSLRGRAGIDEKLSEWTRYVAAAFMILSALLYIAAEKNNW
jgi:protein translocase SecG subunit